LVLLPILAVEDTYILGC